MSSTTGSGSAASAIVSRSCCVTAVLSFVPRRPGADVRGRDGTDIREDPRNDSPLPGSTERARRSCGNGLTGSRFSRSSDCCRLKVPGRGRPGMTFFGRLLLTSSFGSSGCILAAGGREPWSFPKNFLHVHGRCGEGDLSVEKYIGFVFWKESSFAIGREQCSGFGLYRCNALHSNHGWTLFDVGLGWL